MSQEEIKKQGTSEQPTMGFFSRVIGALFAPSKTFAYLDKHPDVWGAMILIMVVFFCTMVIYAQKTDMEALTRNQLEHSGQAERMTDERLEQVVTMGSKIGKYMLYFFPFLVSVTFLILAGILYLVFKLFRGETTFKKTFSVVTYSFLPSIFTYVIAVILLLKRTVNEVPIDAIVKSNLTIFLTQEEVSRFLWRFAASIDIFSIWMIILFSIGMATIKKIKFIYSLLTICGLWLIYVLGASAFATLGG